MSDILSWPYLKEFHDRASVHLAPGTKEWIQSKARAVAGGKAYPANLPLSDTDSVTEDVTDAALYKMVYNAVVPWAGKELAERVAREAMPPKVTETVRDADTTPYREEPMDETVTEQDVEGLPDNAGALFLWNMVKPTRVEEIYGKDMAKVPDYVPKANRRKWAAMFNALMRGGMAEDRIFPIVNAKYVEKKG